MNLCALRAGPGAARLCQAPMVGALGSSQIQVRMLYAPVNPADILAIDGDYPIAIPDGAALGAEGAGLVEAVGGGVETVRPGDLVLPLSRGNWSRRRLLEQDDLVRVPDGIDPRQAAMLRVNPATALHLLAFAELRPGEWLIQNAASSSVGHWVRFFGAESGLGVVNVVQGGGSRGLPNEIEDQPDQALRTAVVPEGRLRAALDCVAGEATGRLASTLAPGGRVIVFGHLSGQPCTVRSQLLTGAGLTITGFSLRAAERFRGNRFCADAFTRIFAAAREPANHQPIRAIVPMTEIDRALNEARQPGRGRVLLDIGA